MSQTRDPRHEALRENLAAYALDALDAGEKSELETHLADCNVCRAELEWLAPAIDLLPASVEQRQPPPRLKRELMSVVEREAAEARREENPGFIERVFGPATRRPVVALATVVLVLAGVGIGVLASRSGDEPGAPTTTLQADALTGAGESLDASLAVTNPGDGGVLEVSRIAPVDRGHVYQLWVQRGDRFQPSATFVPRTDGTAEAAITQSLDGADAVLMTREPRGGSDQPTTRAFASVPLGA